MVHKNIQSRPRSARPVALPRAGHWVQRQPVCHGPLWLDGIEPRTFRGQKAGQNAHPFSVLSDCWLCSRIQVRTCLLTCQEALSQISSQAVLPWACNPVQHHSRNWVVMALTGRPVTKRQLLADRITGRPLLPKHPRTGEGFGVRIPFLPGLFYQVHRLILILPGMHAGQGKPAPPHLVQKTHRPARLTAGPGHPDRSRSCLDFCHRSAQHLSIGDVGMLGRQALWYRGGSGHQRQKRTSSHDANTRRFSL